MTNNLRLALSLLLVVTLISTVYAKSSDIKTLSDSKSFQMNPYLDQLYQSQDKVLTTVFVKGAFSNNPLSQSNFDSLISLIGKEKVSNVFYPESFNVLLTENEVKDLLNNPSVKSIEPAVSFKPTLQDAVNIVGAQQTWSLNVGGTNLDGTGQTGCIIDTGVDFTHPDLSAKNIVGSNIDCFNSDCVPNSAITDQYGHGTYVAGVFAASGQISGIAPGAKIISLKVYNNSEIILGSVTPIVRAIEWCTSHAQQYNIGVISISLGSPTTYQGSCETAYPEIANAIDVARQSNIPVVVSSGNDGSSAGITAPACIPLAVAVGATNKDDTRASYSNYNFLVKIFAPGTNINSTRMGGGYMVASGTSASAPMVAAAFAMYAEMKQLQGAAPRSTQPDDMESLFALNGDPVIGLPSQYKRLNIFSVFSRMLQADLNGDGLVNSADLAQVLGCWGQTPTGSCQRADLNSDSSIGSADLSIILGSWT